MKKLCALAALLFAFALPASARGRIWGYCEKGNQTVKTSGIFSTNKVQGSFPSCTLTAYLPGTLTLATIYSDMSGTPLANPFTANTDGYWFFYADIRVDVKLCSSPACNSTVFAPYTLGDLAPQEESPFLIVTDFPGSDICGKVNTALAVAPASGATLFIPAGSYSFTTTCVLNKPVKLQCSGRNTTQLLYLGGGDAIQMVVGTSPPYMNGGISGCAILGNANPNAVGIHHIDTIGSLYDDLSLENFTGVNSAGIWFDNQTSFSERISLRKLSIFNNSIGIRLTNSAPGNPSTGSFEYHDWSEVHLSINDGQIGISAEGTGVANSCQLQHSNYQFMANVNDPATPATIVRLTGAAQMFQSHYSVFAEETTGAGARMFNICATCRVDGSGVVLAGAIPSLVAAGGVLAIGPVASDPGGTIYHHFFASANLSADRTATFPDQSGNVIEDNGFGNKANAFDNYGLGNTSFIRFTFSGANKWAFGAGASPGGDRGQIFSYTASLAAFDAVATGDTTVNALGTNANVNLNPTGTGNIKAGAASGFSTAINGNSDNAGVLTVGGPGTVTYSFTKTYSIAPICVCSDTTDITKNCKPTTTTSVLTIAGTVGDVVNYVCFPRF